MKLEEWKQRSDELQEKLKPFEDKEITVDKFTEQSEQIEALQHHLNQSKEKLDSMEAELITSLQTNDELKEENKALKEKLDALKNEETEAEDQDQDYDVVGEEELKESEVENGSEPNAWENQYSVPEDSTV